MPEYQYLRRKNFDCPIIISRKSPTRAGSWSKRGAPFALRYGMSRAATVSRKKAEKPTIMR